MSKRRAAAAAAPIRKTNAQGFCFGFGLGFLGLALLLSTPAALAEAPATETAPAAPAAPTVTVTDEMALLMKEQAKGSCGRISRGTLNEPLFAKLPLLTEAIRGIEGRLKSHKFEGFAGQFHPNFKSKRRMIADIGPKLSSFYGRGYGSHLYRVFAIHPSTDRGEIVDCRAEQPLALTSFYGYPVAVGLRLGVNGAMELGYVYALLVPSPRDNRWYIAGWHHQQWSYLGQNYEFWAGKAKQAAAEGDNLLVHAHLDIAQKLLTGGKLMHFKEQDELINLRRQAFGTEDGWVSQIRTIVGDNRIIYAGTLLAEGAPGMFLRYQLAEELPTPKLQRLCAEAFTKLLPQRLVHNSGGGIRCGFVLPRENPSHDGKLGSVFLPAASIDKTLAKTKP